MYLIYGESFRLIEEEIDKIVKEKENLITMDLEICTLEDVLLEATYDSFFHEKKTILVKNASIFTSSSGKEENLDFFYSYMEHPNSLVTILFTTNEKIDMRKKITKTFQEKYKIISVGNMSKKDLISKVRDLIFKNKYKIANDALEYIIESCQNNYDLIYNELQKLFLFYEDPQMIILEDAKEIVSKSLMDNHFRFVEAVVEKNLKKANTILEDLYLLKVDPIALLMLLAREFRLMLSVKIMMERGYPRKSICKELTLQDWQVQKLAINSAKYYEEILGTYLIELAHLDYKIKSGQTDKFFALKTFLLQIV